MSRQRLHHGNSSGEEEQEGLLTTRIGSKHFQFSDEGRRRKISKSVIPRDMFLSSSPSRSPAVVP